MDLNLTYNSVVFSHSYTDKDASLRRSIARGINTPDDLIVKSQTYVDSKTKVSGNRYTIRIDQHDVDANLQKIITSAYLVIAVPDTATSTQVNLAVATFKAAVANADLIANVLGGQK